MKAVVNLSDYSYVLNDGVLISHGTPNQIANDPLVIEAYLGQGAAKAMTNKPSAKIKATKTGSKS